MEKKKLYKVKKWNKPAFINEGNLYWPGGEVQLTAPRVSPYVDWSNPLQRAAAIGTTAGLVNGFSNMANMNNSFNNTNTVVKGTRGGNALTGILGAVGGTAGNMLGSAIGGGYSTGGVGEGVAGIGNTIGGLVSTVNPLVGAAVQFGSGLVGGIINRGWGVKENKENVAAIKQNTANARMMGNALAGVTDSKSFFDTAGEMTTGSGFSAGDLYKDGWFTSSGTKKGNSLINKENNALAFQKQGMVTGAENVDSIMDDNVFSNYAAFGGYVPTGMGAIDYGFMSDWLTGLNKRRKQTSDIKEANDYTNIGIGLRAFGGDMQTNSADFPSGLVHVDAGGTHEESPYDGVQMGVDPEGTPNLVEEGEMIWNNYVFSNRIELDEEAKKIFHFPRKTSITYAEAAKKLEKEISERVNDPISKAGFKVQMEKLEEQQERQKQEMEAQRAKEAFEALSPEEQVAVMQQAAGQEQVAQEQAMQQQAMMEQQAMQEQGIPQANMPGTEQMMPQEAMMGQPQVVEGQPVMAEGGEINVFAGTQPGSNQMKNAGTFIKGTIGENWNTYTRNGLRDYLTNIIQRINMAPDEETKNAIRNEAITTVGNIQQAYAKAYQKDLTPSQENDAVRALQTAFQNAGGNAYFKGIDANINLPVGHNTEDTYEKGWIDGLWGPRTSIRNWGSTEYGDADSYKDIADLATQAGLVYAPNEAWKYGDNTLYGLSLAGNPVTEDHKGQTVAVQYGAPWASENAETPAGTASGTGTAGAGTKTNDDGNLKPKLRPEWLRYAGLLGPAAGLGLMAAGVGRPDTSVFDDVLEGYDSRGIGQMEPRYIGNYLRYSPMDIWFEQNRLNANSRATDRAIANSGSNYGTKIAGMLANGYNNQVASGDLYRKALEYNDAKRKDVAEFNRATDMFNAQAYNQAQQFNAQARNTDRHMRAQLGMQAAAQKADMDAGWYNSLYGNIGSLTKAVADIGVENKRDNMINWMLSKGVLGHVNPDDEYLQGRVTRAACGGKLKKKKKRGLTC